VVPDRHRAAQAPGRGGGVVRVVDPQPAGTRG
jgi:hypothetical protein